ncbi:MAG: aldolase [Thermoplasmata archaeon]|nr:aldolase [Thermoplasmata archaeon]
MLTEKDVKVPLDVPKEMRKEYIKNYLKATHNTGKLMLFAGDQKVEHLNGDFYGEGIHQDDEDPEHLFRIAKRGKIGVFATQLGLISRYGMDYRKVPYLVKVNSKTNLVKASHADPFSTEWYDLEQVYEMKMEHNVNILGVGYTIYIGSDDEDQMLQQAAQLIHNAHRYGLLTVLWIYPRGKSVEDETTPHLIAGACGVAACLGSDFVKVNYPKVEGKEQPEVFKEAVAAAGRTGVVCAGGSSTDVRSFLQRLHDQIFISGAVGNATGRNIHQKSLDEAVRMCDAISAITIGNRSVDQALKIYKGN